MSIGSAPNMHVVYQSPFIAPEQCRITFLNDVFTVESRASGNAADAGPIRATGTLTVNGAPLAYGHSRTLRAGDIIRLLDLCIMIGFRFISINQPQGLILRPNPAVRPLSHTALMASSPEPRLGRQTGSHTDGRSGEPLQSDEPYDSTSAERRYFYPAPRLMRSIRPFVFKVSPPPNKKARDDTPVIMQLGPSLLMGLASVFMVTSSIAQIAGGGSVMTALPMLAMSISMVAGMVLWPIISNRYNKRRDARNEKKRQSAYADYLNRVEAAFEHECDEQADILRENRVSVDSIRHRVAKISPSTMDRSLTQSDFFDLRVGIGSEELNADISYPQDAGFSMEHDVLLDQVKELADNPPKIKDVPVALNLAVDHAVGIVGPRRPAWAFLRGLIVQICGLYNYNDVKMIVVADKRDEKEWRFVRRLPHLFDSTRDHRFLAVEAEDMSGIERLLENEMTRRKERHDPKSDLSAFGTYYVVICANPTLTNRCEAIGRLLRNRENTGFSLVFLADTLRSLPGECGKVIELRHATASADMQDMRDGADADADLDDSTFTPTTLGDTYVGRMFSRDDVNGTRRDFAPDIYVERGKAESFARNLAFIELQQNRAGGIDGAADSAGAAAGLPQRLGFMELFKAGRVNQLNVARRWRDNDASRTLKTPVGLDAHGDDFMLNLHESFHGPHGLIAGMTGSGKSEFIITYVLSMALNYAPDEAAFVLIDYKGGGLAGAFDNERYRLPHLAGTITNLDGSAISRSLVSIQSELKRRQSLFNEARDITGEPTMDIYKYLSYYRQGVLNKPCPHLFIVADEFAELKQQEPEFMQELISAARIGRSLGVHLILATQKPSGVVNDQIWSNSRFKVCLKVADNSDSKEMIRRPDAAELKDPGRFYLLVGYNEYFDCGQSAYTGTKYSPADHYEPKKDDAVVLIDNTGTGIASLRPVQSVTRTNTSELNAVLGHICEVAKAVGKSAQPLWLDPVPVHITLDDIDRSYGRELNAAYGSSAAAAAGAATAAGAAAAVAGVFDATTALKAVVGVLDDPAHQRQMPLIRDFVQIGNLLMLGAATSGIEPLVATVLESLFRRYSPGQVNAYALDMGSGALSAFADDPHMGGVVAGADPERTASLFHLLEREIANRRELFAPAGGTYAAYAQWREERGYADGTSAGADRRDTDDAASPSSPATQSPMPPRIVFVLTNVAAFLEQYEQWEDRLVSLAREVPRFGIHMMLTASTPNQVRPRLRATFGASLATSFNDQNDYLSVVDSIRGIVPPKQPRRGLVQEGKEVYEYQGASIGSIGANESEVIRAWSKRAATQWRGTRAKPIPVLPTVVRACDFDTAQVSRETVPMGYNKTEVEPMLLDGRRAPAMMVTGNDADALTAYAIGLVQTLHRHAVSYAIVDQDDAVGQYLGEAGLPVGASVAAGAVGAAAPNAGAGAGNAGNASDANGTDTSAIGPRLVSLNSIARFIDTLDSGVGAPSVVCFTSLVSLMGKLDSTAAQKLKTYIEQERFKRTTALVICGEAWRFASVYDPWMKVVNASPAGMWIGAGFLDQSMFRYGRVQEAFRAKAGPADGFTVFRGDIQPVRVLQPMREAAGPAAERSDGER